MTVGGGAKDCRRTRSVFWWSWVFWAQRERDTTDIADAAVEVPVGEARPPGISQHSTATESEDEGSSGEAGSSWPGADDMTRHVGATW